MKYESLPLKTVFSIENILSFYHLYFHPDYHYHGEQHNFWELVYVADGKIGVTADNRCYELPSGAIVFHRPGEFHTLWSAGGTAPEVIIVSFACHSNLMQAFEGRVAVLDPGGRACIQALAKHLNCVIARCEDDGQLHRVIPKLDCSPYEMQAAKNLLELLLIHLRRPEPLEAIVCKRQFAATHEEIYRQTINYFTNNIFEKLTLEDICRHIGVSRTTLKSIFAKYTGNSIMKHFLHMKIEKAKEMLAAGAGIGTVSDRLGFSSQNYFCCAFKREMGVTPFSYKTGAQHSEAAPEQDRPNGAGRGKNVMRIIVCKDYEELSKKAAKMVASVITLNPSCVLGLATGSTPVGTYQELIRLYQAGEVDFSAVTTFNLDEYYPIAPENPQSYHYFMQQNLFGHININPENTYIPNGLAKDTEAECHAYEEKIAAKGGIDLQILGIGQNGHIGFNEPDDNLNTSTHLTALTESTISANARFFENIDDVPRQALTMGISTILRSKKILLLASGKTKYPVVRELLNEDINTEIPATLLKVHRDVVLLCDREAYEGTL